MFYLAPAFATRLALSLVFLAGLGAPGLYAAEEPGAGRPRIGLVLAGGGARGAAHVGLLKVIEELRIPIDYVAGTSMGSIVGGLYASGMSPEEIQQAMLAIDWDAIFDDAPPRQDRSFRRKTDDDLYLVKGKIGLGSGGVKLPLAVIHGQKFDLELNRLLLPMSDIQDFDRLPIPFRAVATDLETGGEVVLGKGSLARAIRASMAVPGAFDPVEIDGRILVDGGLANNVPVSVARAMGAEVVIVGDLSGPLLSREQIKSVISVMEQLSNFLTDRNVQVQLASLTERDVRVPIGAALGDIGSADFDRAAEAIPMGEEAARAMAPQLRELSVPPEAFSRHMAARGSRPGDGPVIDFVRIDNRSRLGDELISARLHVTPGEPLDVPRLESDIGRIYGLDVFESVRYSIVDDNGRTGLVIEAQEKPWGPGYLQLGLAFSDNFEGDNRFGLGASYLLTGINALNGEIRVVTQIGDEPLIGGELHQPLDPLSRYFVSAKAILQRENVYLWDGNEITAQYNVDQVVTGLGVGRELGTWGEARLGYRWATGNADLRVGNPGARDFEFDRGEAFLRLSLDKLDDVNFPREGYSGQIEWLASRSALGADSDFDQVSLSYAHVKSRDRHTLGLGLSLGTTLDDDAPIQSLFRIGGFSRLSGFQPGQLSGQDVGILTAAYYRRLGDIKLLPMYAGATLEYGNVWQDGIDFGDAILAGSVFLGADTPIGPLYGGYGRSDTGADSIFLYLGRLF
jgi:NTE family protein